MRMIKTRNMRDMFSSDCEAVSVASDNPNMYHRSISMVSDFQMVSNVINDTDLLLEKYSNVSNDSLMTLIFFLRNIWAGDKCHTATAEVVTILIKYK